MRRLLLFFFVIASAQLFAQQELKLGEAFLQSVQDKNFNLLKPWLGANAKTMQQKWQEVVDNAHREGFNIKALRVKKIIDGEQVPGLPMKSFVAVYEYDGKEWDDLLLMITTGKEMKLVEIPLTSYMFVLDEARRGKNIPK